ncbi:hypothetical protein [Actinomadura litoris]|uniref:SWIM-type domain-containing protein n=1 Tax=Actinomadura litoris TaxID=2678616 RepID=A0A7K1LAN9_9ACTN|nr:hypothetical protein [Actinomadura litoris]MUN41492.1 hypothetical protein [Actinomadura litoris]
MSIRAKALRYLRNERVRVVSAATPAGELRPHEVTAYVQGHAERHTVRFAAGVWSCTCLNGGCGYVASVQLVTGWQGAASLLPDRPPA